LVTDLCEQALVEEFGLKYAANLSDAIALAEEIAGKDAGILLMPNGVEIIPV